MDTPLGGAGLSPAFGQGAGNKKIARNEPIIVDFAGCRDGFAMFVGLVDEMNGIRFAHQRGDTLLSSGNIDGIKQYR